MNIRRNYGEPEDEKKRWLQENTRIILSILIVIAIAAGVYSYSKRTAKDLTQESIIDCPLIEIVDGNVRCYNNK